MNKIQQFTLLLISFLSIACTAGMPPAVAPTNPPKVEKSNFDVAILVGRYQQFGAPKMFLWPVFKADEMGKFNVPMNFSEKAKVRQVISALADDVASFGDQKKLAEDRITQKYKSLIELEKLYAQDKCYALCDPEDFFECDTTNKCTKYNSTWKTPEGPEEESLIVQCQANEESRRALDEQKKRDIAEQVEPLRIKEAQASLALLEKVDQDYFKELTSFELETKSLADNPVVRLQYGGVQYVSGNPGSDFQIREMILDKTDGYLSFKIDAVDLENDNKVYGEIFFDLELNLRPEGLKIEGDVRLNYLSGQEERIGRFSLSGEIAPFGAVESSCK